MITSYSCTHVMVTFSQTPTHLEEAAVLSNACILTVWPLLPNIKTVLLYCINLLKLVSPRKRRRRRRRKKRMRRRRKRRRKGRRERI